MKKFFAIAIIAVSVVACNNSGKGKDGDKDSTGGQDTTQQQQPTQDTTHPAQDTTHPADSTAPKM